jgi:hypothetical protein
VTEAGLKLVTPARNRDGLRVGIQPETSGGEQQRRMSTVRRTPMR